MSDGEAAVQEGAAASILRAEDRSTRARGAHRS